MTLQVVGVEGRRP